MLEEPFYFTTRRGGLTRPSISILFRHLPIHRVAEATAGSLHATIQPHAKQALEFKRPQTSRSRHLARSKKVGLTASSLLRAGLARSCYFALECFAKTRLGS
jgi:hypothetical protein